MLKRPRPVFYIIGRRNEIIEAGFLVGSSKDHHFYSRWGFGPEYTIGDLPMDHRSTDPRSNCRLAGERSRKRSNDDGQEGYVRINETKIHLLTATRSKGHEYDAVIVLDADAEEWPNHMSEDIEEERRLFYVALSRARKYLCFVVDSDHVGSRFLLEAGLR